MWDMEEADDAGHTTIMGEEPVAVAVAVDADGYVDISAARGASTGHRVTCAA